MEENQKSKQFGIGIAVIVLAILICGYLYAQNYDHVAQQSGEPTSSSSTSPSPSPTPIDTSSWKTYTNEKIGLLFKYPEELSDSISEEGEENSKIESPPRKEHSYQRYAIRMRALATEVSVEYFSKGAKLTYTDFLNGAWGHEQNSPYEHITINTKDAIKFVYEKNSQTNIQIGLQTLQGGFIVITLETPSEHSTNIISLFTALLETVEVS